MAIQLHLDDLLAFSPLNSFSASNSFSVREHQLDPFDILLKGKRMDSEEEAYLSYEEMSLGELDSYYFRSD